MPASQFTVALTQRQAELLEEAKVDALPILARIASEQRDALYLGVATWTVYFERREKPSEWVDKAVMADESMQGYKRIVTGCAGTGRVQWTFSVASS